MRVASDVFQRNRGGSSTCDVLGFHHDDIRTRLFALLASSFCGSFIVRATPLSSFVVHLDNFPQTRDANETSQRAVAYADHIRALALSFPQTYEDAPWGFPVFKVGANKLFAWLTERDEHVEVTVKLTAEEREIAELLPWVRRASHVGRYGWITAEVTSDETLEATLEWIRESYWLKAPADVREAAFDGA